MNTEIQKLFLQSKVLPADKITKKIKMQKRVKISGGDFVLNGVSSYPFGVLIQNYFLRCCFLVLPTVSLYITCKKWLYLFW